MTSSETILRADAALTPTGTVAPAEIAFSSEGIISYVGGVRRGSVGVRDLSGHVLMPGLVNGHTHSAMTLQRGVSDDDGFMPWLRAVQSTEQVLTRDDVEAGLQLAMLEMIETGTTTFADMYYWDAGLIEQVCQAGMRVLAAPASFTAETIGFPGVSPASGDEVNELTEQLAHKYQGHPQVKIAFGPHAPYTCPPEFLADISERAQRLGVPVHIHVSESLAEIAEVAKRYATTPAEHLAKVGLFDASVIAAHCVHVTPEEIQLLVRSGAAASHNPVSNLKLGDGVAPLPALMEAGVRLALGTDGAASNNTLDLFEEIKLATILHRGVTHDAGAVRAANVIEMATSRGAEAIGFRDTGSLEAGKLADVIALDISGTSAAQFNAPSLVSHLGFTATGKDVQHVFIGGREVYADGVHLSLDADAVRQRARLATERLRGAAQGRA